MNNDQPKTGASLDSVDSRKELIDLLGFEIARIESEQQRPGWTKWALAGAVASCVWLFLDQFESHEKALTITNVLFLTLIWLLVWDALIAFKRFMSMGFPPVSGKAGFWFTNVILSEARLLLSAKFIEKVCMLAIVWTCPLIPHDCFFYIVVFVFASSLFGVCIGLLLSYWKFKISNDRPKHPWVFVCLNIIGVIPATFVLIKLVDIWVTHSTQITIVDLRTSLLLFAFAMIVPLSLTDRIHYPFLTALLDLRRKLALQEITYEAAKQQANIFFKGMDAKEALQEDIDSVLSQYRDAASASDLISNEACALLSPGAYAPLIALKSDMQPLALQILPRLESIEKSLKDAEKSKSNLKGLIAVFGWLAPSNEPEMKKLYESVEATTTETKKYVQSKVEQARRLLSEANKAA